jgi:hypothetical protein
MSKAQNRLLAKVASGKKRKKPRPPEGGTGTTSIGPSFAESRIAKLMAMKKNAAKAKKSLLTSKTVKVKIIVKGKKYKIVSANKPKVRIYRHVILKSRTNTRKRSRIRQ